MNVASHGEPGGKAETARLSAFEAAHAQKLLDALPQIAGIQAGDGRMVVVNRGWQAFFGPGPGCWTHALHPEDGAVFRGDDGPAGAEGMAETDCRLRGQDGDWHWFGIGLSRFEDGLWLVSARPLGDTARPLAATLDTEGLVTAEMHHRIKNLFTVVTGLIALAKREVPLNQEAVGVLTDLKQRILSMGRANDMLLQSVTRAGQHAFDPIAVSQAVLQPYEGHVDVRGGVEVLPPHLLTPLVLILHELATNSLKHGGLRHEGGFVDLIWTEDAGAYELTWIESGSEGPGDRPEPGGFGSAMLNAVVAMANGTLDFEWQHDGLRARVRLDKT